MYGYAFRAYDAKKPVASKHPFEKQHWQQLSSEQWCGLELALSTLTFTFKAGPTSCQGQTQLTFSATKKVEQEKRRECMGSLGGMTRSEHALT